jgi:hypothetical protein
MMMKTFQRIAFTAVLALLIPAAALSAQDAFAEIRELSGTVEIQTAGGHWTPARAGDKLGKSALISTGFKSTALLAVGNSTLVVRPLTRLSIEELARSQGDEEVNVFLRTGRVRAEVKAPEGRKTQFSVRSPSATASVRGTAFNFDTQNLSVSEGTVRFSGANGGAALVDSGKSSSLSAGGTPTAAREAPRAIVAQDSGGSFVPDLPIDRSKGAGNSPLDSIPTPSSSAARGVASSSSVDMQVSW